MRRIGLAIIVSSPIILIALFRVFLEITHILSPNIDIRLSTLIFLAIMSVFFSTLIRMVFHNET